MLVWKRDPRGHTRSIRGPAAVAARAHVQLL